MQPYSWAMNQARHVSMNCSTPRFAITFANFSIHWHVTRFTKAICVIAT